MLKAFFAGLFTGGIFMIVLPALMIYLNNMARLPLINNLVLRLSGILMIFLGILLFIYPSILFLRFGKGTPAPIDPPKKLVIKSIYKKTRNPIYLGYFSVLLGIFLLFGHILLLAYAILIMVFMHIYVTRYEEPKLKERFGKDFERYMKKVPRWL
jgi:protein-S-isoprenylcysteine O-methyltransferase Ste14